MMGLDDIALRATELLGQPVRAEKDIYRSELILRSPTRWCGAILHSADWRMAPNDFAARIIEPMVNALSEWEPIPQWNRRSEQIAAGVPK